MAFDAILNIPLDEQELLRLVYQELQQKFSTYQNVHFFLKFTNAGDRRTIVTDIKTFPSNKDLGNYHWGQKTWPSCLMISFAEDRYKIFCRGQHYFAFSLVDSLEIEVIDNDRRKFVEGQAMPSRELLAKGFGEITDAVQSLARKKAV